MGPASETNLMKQTHNLAPHRCGSSPAMQNCDKLLTDAAFSIIGCFVNQQALLYADLLVKGP